MNSKRDTILCDKIFLFGGVREFRMISRNHFLFCLKKCKLQKSILTKEQMLLNLSIS